MGKLQENMGVEHQCLGLGSTWAPKPSNIRLPGTRWGLSVVFLASEAQGRPTFPSQLLRCLAIDPQITPRIQKQCQNMPGVLGISTIFWGLLRVKGTCSMSQSARLEQAPSIASGFRLRLQTADKMNFCHYQIEIERNVTRIVRFNSQGFPEHDYCSDHDQWVSNQRMWGLNRQREHHEDTATNIICSKWGGGPHGHSKGQLILMVLAYVSAFYPKDIGQSK